MLAALMAIVLAQPAMTADQFLKIVAIEGDGAFNDTRRQLGTETVVEVRDEREQLVEGAEVVFTAPLIGAGGTYAGGANVFKGITDNTGRARTPGFKPNQTDGRFNIKVTATKANRSGKLVISQTNSAAVRAVGAHTPGGGGKTKLLFGLAGAGASIGLLAVRLAGGGGNGGGGGGTPTTPTRPPTTLSVGGISIGGPR
jgi:hypothetical protein